jgi:hypothetical protein
MHEREYKKIRSTIEAEYRKKLDALELIYGMAGKNGNSSPSPVKGELAQAVVSSIRQTTVDFNVRDIEQALKIMHPTLMVKRGSLSNTLKRLEGREIELVEKGSGKRPSQYRRKVRTG